jgi:hypothetical protein
MGELDLLKPVLEQSVPKAKLHFGRVELKPGYAFILSRSDFVSQATIRTEAGWQTDFNKRNDLFFIINREAIVSQATIR